MPDGQVADGGEEGAQFGHRGGVAFDLGVGLLEAEAGGEAERQGVGEAGGEEGGQRHDALGVEGAGQAGFFLDVDDFAFAEAHGGGDANGVGEAAVAEIDDGQPVDLADPLAAGFDVQVAAQDGFLQLGVEAAGARLARLDGGLDRFDTDAAGASAAGDEVGFAHQVEQALHVARQPFGILRLARGVLDQAGAGGALEGEQIFLARQGGDDAGVVEVAGGGARQLVLEVSNHFEQLGEVGVVGLQQVIQLALADQDDLDVERDRHGVERHRVDQRQHLAERFDPNLARTQGAFQTLPGIRLHQQLVRVEDEIAAVGLVQCARFDEGEVGDQGAEVFDVLDPADEVGVGGVIGRHHRRAGEAVAIDQDVDLVAAETGRRRQGETVQQRWRLRGFAEFVGVLDEVGLDVVEIGAHGLDVGVFVAQLAELVFHRQAGKLAVEGAQAGAFLALPLRAFADELVQLFAHLDHRL